MDLANNRKNKLIKICGLKDIETAKYAESKGADFIGLVFANSKRKVELNQAKAICNGLGNKVKKVGVFVDETPDRVEQVVRECGLDIIQLHGKEKVDDYKYIGKQIIKAIPVGEQDTIESVKATIDSTCKGADYILLDTKKKEVFGGLGIAFDWKIVDKLTLEYENIILAGGLNTENILSALSLVNPMGVDVSSGVETDGVKDKAKILEFINKIKRIEENK